VLLSSRAVTEHPREEPMKRLIAAVAVTGALAGISGAVAATAASAAPVAASSSVKDCANVVVWWVQCN
jgi:ABC-type glycerol-3-phosphate transport system substrate-binding protein